ncbi:2Fe-2S iron-sulfur cluster binding domain-containing protein [Maritimibacter sp. DP07]|uniref:2Fe-2S iron-sulfur cluster binding domain-containing protein n=2 Tax=Maritimibacter harenae TaxID=2606218 RepID=A0A845M283_9RHOB|nr:(2Fe-2S)-binding protein [Maritimibacter sp.]MBL6430256.1 (2Fe-2S)-binding protein [Maritimibacter sp.]MZR13676.1 2Fe-2S iron-sulfur cluster binding domain-containing protein [Maritimibacter harenae]
MPSILDETCNLTLTVNGRAETVTVPTDATLLEVLRERLGLMGTRFGCGQEQCGACMVLVDDSPVFACTRLVDSLDGSEIRTVEGLGEDDPLIAALLEHQAAQCAFCLPGIIMSAKALLDRTPSPERSDILEALDPHLCRCGAHPRIVDAILSVAQP